MESDLTPGESTLKHLWDLANALQPTNHTNRLLRSHYLTICKKIGARDVVQLPAANFAPSVMCPRCSSIWSESEFSLRLLPQRLHSSKAQKLVDKFKSAPGTLTKKQRTRAKWLKKRTSSHVETTCGFCKSKTLHALIKPVAKPAVVEEPKQAEVPLKKKKKKKSKDKTAGLKLTHVIPPKPAKKPNPPKQTPKQTTKQTPKGKKPPPKVVSNTQKQNSLLQLASMLKNRTPASGASSSSQLEKMLR